MITLLWSCISGFDKTTSETFHLILSIVILRHNIIILHHSIPIEIPQVIFIQI